MARFAKPELEQKILHAKDLYVKGYTIEGIAEILGLAASTVKKWSHANNFEDAKRASQIRLSELRNIILESFEQLRQGKTPKITPDQAAKYAASFEKFSDKRKLLTYIYESFDLLTIEFLHEIETAIGTEQKQLAFDMFKKGRALMDKVTNKITTQLLNDE